MNHITITEKKSIIPDARRNKIIIDVFLLYNWSHISPGGNPEINPKPKLVN